MVGSIADDDDGVIEVIATVGVVVDASRVIQEGGVLLIENTRQVRT
jgi:hypothetical protein